jgi:hypothetical protein
MKPFAHARCHRVARGADIAVMHQKMFGAEVRVEHHGEQDIAQPALEAVFLVHELVAVVDADGAGDHPDPEEEHNGFQRAEVLGPGDIVEQPEECKKLERCPDLGDERIGFEMFLANAGIGVFEIEPKQGVKARKEIPGGHWQQHNRPAAIEGPDPGKRDEYKREPERQSTAEAGCLLGGKHGETLY